MYLVQRMNSTFSIHFSILFEKDPLWSEIWRSAVFLGRKIADLDINKLMPVCFAFFSKINESFSNSINSDVEFYRNRLTT